MKIKKHVIVVGAGFGGLQAVKKLSRCKDIEITFIDRTNHHLFQPLLYQVATAVLSPADIAIPIRSLMERRGNVKVLMDEVTGVDKERSILYLNEKELKYDFLVLAMGALTGYFGHNEWKQFTTGLKNLTNALIIRNRMLFAYEIAESHPERSKELLKFIIIGGGPTGVELAGSFSEMAHWILRKDFRNIDTSKSEITLIEAGSDLLPTFNRELSVYTKKVLQKRGVKVMLDSRVRKIEDNKVFVNTLDGEKIIEGNLIIWAAGVQPVPITTELDVSLDRGKRVYVNKFCSLDEYPNIFIIGDMADFRDDEGKPLPGVSPVAMQQGRYVAKFIINKIENKTTGPFHYLNKGNMATIGRKLAVAEYKSFKLKGFLGWLAWLFVHLYYMVGFKNKISILITWMWSYLTYGAAARVILNPIKPDLTSDED